MSRWFHKHKFVPFRADVRQLGVLLNSGKTVPTRKVTEVYEICSCGERRMRDLDGEWTLEMLGWTVSAVHFENNPDKMLILSNKPVAADNIGRLVYVREV